MGGDTPIRRNAQRSMTDRDQVEKGCRDSETGKANEHDGNHGIPNERDIAPQGGNDCLAVHHHDLMLHQRAGGHAAPNLGTTNRPANIFCVKLRGISDASAHACHDGRGGRRGCCDWRALGDSNPCYRRERAVS